MPRLAPSIELASRKTILWTVLLLLVALATSASAQLARVGPINPANGFPAWYQDKTGLALDFCDNQSQAELNGGWCFLLPVNVPNGTAPETFPNNFALEHFYWAANSGIRKVAVGTQTVVVMLVAGLEGSFINNISPIPGDQIVFARVRIKINPVPYDGDYTVYTPFGKFFFPGQLAGQKRGIFFTADVGLSVGQFQQALDGRIGPFLLPSTAPGGPELPPIPLLQPGQDPFYDALVALGGAVPYPNNGRKYLANPGRIGPITGSPLPPYVVNDGTTRNANIFRVEGPNGFVFESTDFTLTGRVMEGPIAGETSVDGAYYARSATATKVDVYATATPATQGRIPAGPAPATTAPQLAYFDAPCTATLDAAGNPGPPYSAPAGLLPNQMVNSGTSYFGQSHPNPIPAELCFQSNSVNALGQTVTNFLPQSLADQIFITEALYDPSTQSMSVKATSSDQVVPQTLTVEGFGAINPVTGQLVVNPILAAPYEIKVISSGSGLNRMQMSTGAVAGGAATLPTAVNDSATVFENCSATASTVPCATPIIINVLGNDTNAAGGTVTLTSQPAMGAATVNPDNTISYKPNFNVFGTDSFTYSVTVGTAVSNSASVTVTITHVNQAPTANNDTIGALRGLSISFNVLSNDSDPDGAADLSKAVIVTGNAALGIVAGTVYPGGVITFTPPANLAAGPYQFTYNAVDVGGLQSALPATVTVNISTTEAIVVAKDIYTQGRSRWTVGGTISPVAGQTMTVAYDPGTVATYKVNGQCTGNAAGTVIGTATVDALGNWLFDQILTSTTGVLNPSNTLGNSTGFWCTPPKTMRITSSLTGGSVTSAISFR